MKISICLATAALICGSQLATAQHAQRVLKPIPVTKTVEDPTWVRRVSRLINIADTTDITKRKLRREDDDRQLSEILIDMVRMGKIKAYSNKDSKFSELMTKAQLTGMLTPQPDTIELSDPVSGKTIRKIVKKDVNYDDMTKYRVLEEWTYNRYTSSTTVQIIGIAPMRDIYGDDGSYRGHQAMFWLKYADVQATLKRYEDSHPVHNISLAIWEDYLSEAK